MISEATLLLFIVVVSYTLWSYLVGTKRMPPCPQPLPVIGNLLSIVKWINTKTMHLEMLKLAKMYHGKVFTLKLPGENIVVINSAATAREALVTKRDDFAGRPFLFTFDYLTRGSKDIGAQDFNSTLVLQRKIVYSAIRSYLPKIGEKITMEVDELFKRLENYEGKPMRPEQDISLTVLNIICKMVYGKRYELDDPEFQKVITYNKLFFSLLGSLNILNIFPFLINFPIKDSKNIRYVVKTRDEILNREYHKHQQTYQDGNVRDLTDALIKALKESEQKDSDTMAVLTEDHVVMTMNDIFSAGYETSSSQILWFLYFMARHPDVQEKVQKEIDSIVGKDIPVKWADRTSLHYTSATVEEVIRISTVGPISVPRKTTKDTSLEGFHIPKNTAVFIHTMAFHHDEKEWNNPSQFNPERFLDQDGKFIQISGIASYLPFGAGRRVCVGDVLAKQQIFLIVVPLMQKFTIETKIPASELPITGEMNGLIHGPKDIEISFIKRQ